MHSVTRRRVLKGVATLAAAGASGIDRAWSRSGTSPNILILLADDLRFDAVGYRNKAVRTPHLDRLAGEGVRFHNAFVTTSICATSRASILTGAYARRHKVWDFATPLPRHLFENAYPAVLRRAGYRTGFIGKYGVADTYEKSADGRVIAQTIPVSDTIAFDFSDTFNDFYDQKDAQRQLHNSRRVAAKAKEFIRSTRSKQPFCLSLSFKAPHIDDDGDAVMGPFVAEPDMLALYAQDIFTQTPVMSETVFQAQPDFIRASLARGWWEKCFPNEERWLDAVRKYYAMVSGIDRAIGQTVAELERRGLLDNTVIVFTSDNGFFLGDYGLGGKWYGYEASIRVPLMIRLPRGAARREVFETALNIDLAPTILALAGEPIPATMQGQDLSPLWSDVGTRRPWREDFLYEHYLSGLEKPTSVPENLIPSSEGVRNQRYTYLRYPRQAGQNEQLFDRVEDANELKNIIHTAPIELVQSLRKRTDMLIAENT